MVSNTEVKTNISQADSVAIIGSNVAAVQAALTMARMGVHVNLISDSAALGLESTAGHLSGESMPDRRYVLPLLIQAVSHPLITLYCNTEVEGIEGEQGDLIIKILQRPRFINQELCSACGRCQEECSARVTELVGDQKITHSAIHMPLLGEKAVPSAFVIDKKELAPCRVNCPLGINAQGFISLLSKGKTDKALTLINEAAPFAGVLGRVCRHPCEENCNRSDVDAPVSIRALHRYSADNAGSINYSRKAPARSRLERIAIIGSGPAGLTAAWELTRRGYSPTVFEAHGVVGGMLATGIPRFRLPREVREREIEAIKRLGVDIRTGITVGRDVTFSYLRERGYQAFFLAIGTQKNNWLNIPGEELVGVVDCMSLLLTLNLMVDSFVGNNIVIIGDGNTAIDSARTAIRRSGGTVTVLSWTVPEEITANEEELEEAIQEGVKIEYCAAPVEILGDGVKVAGIHCQKTRLTDKLMANGRHLPEPIPGTGFMIEADHVVVAIGQTADSSQLNMPRLEVDSSSGIIVVNPLTLETGISGVFAGGDCITGPNNVVEAMAAGMRAAESIDRYIQGIDLNEGRTIEPPPTAEVDLEVAEISPYKRAVNPAIRPKKRISSFEETTGGLLGEVAYQETQRCLNCAKCSQCMECTTVCELDAVNHDDCVRYYEIGAKSVLDFNNTEGDRKEGLEGVRVIASDGDNTKTDVLTEAMAIALETAINIQPYRTIAKHIKDTEDTSVSSIMTDDSELSVSSRRLGVFLCNCGGSISSIIDLKAVARRLSGFSGVTCIREIAQACTEEGAKQIAEQAEEWSLDSIVLAACRCCGLEQVCYSCTDRRQMCLQNLGEQLVLPQNTVVEYCNIREQCAWTHKDEPKDATRKAAQIIAAAITRIRMSPRTSIDETAIEPGILIIGNGLASMTSARALASRGYHVDLLSKESGSKEQKQYEEQLSSLFMHYDENNLVIKSWPDSIELHGSPGSYEVRLTYNGVSESIAIGSVMVDVKKLNEGESPVCNAVSNGGLLGRVIDFRKTRNEAADAKADLTREMTICETAGLFLLPEDDGKAIGDEVMLGLAVAARIASYIEKAVTKPRVMAIDIDSHLCRGCGDCHSVCPFIEMRERENGTVYAYIDKALCLGCGACVAGCSTGAIKQPVQGDEQIVGTLRVLLGRV